MDSIRHKTLLVLLLTLSAVALGQTVTFSHTGGYYAEPFALNLTAPAGYTIHYTLNGSIPTVADKAYTGPITLSEACYSRSEIFRLRNSPQQYWYSPEEVEHIIVVRAALFNAAGQRVSEVGTQPYLIGSLMDMETSLPVMSLCVDSADLFDYDSGIFVPGRLYDPSSPDPNRTGNYYQRGDEWERLAHLSYIVNGQQRLNQDCGVRMHGISQRNKPQKAMTLYAREEYGKKKFAYRFFANRDADKYKRLVLRSFQATLPYSEAGVTDWLCQQIAEPLRCDNLAATPVALFLNGEYWGIYFLEEKPDEHYIENLYGIDDEAVDIINWWDFAESGTIGRWEAFYTRLESLDPADSADLAWLKEEVDIDALIDYMLLQLFIINSDWPANNARCWSAAGCKWRWIFFDGDYSFYNTYFDVYANLVCDDDSTTYPTSAQATLLFRRLLQYDEMKLKAVKRLQELAGNELAYRTTGAKLEQIRNTVASEIKYQKKRFNSPTEKGWKKALDNLDDLLSQRAGQLLEGFSRFLEIYDIGADSLNVFPNPSLGQAKLSFLVEEPGLVKFDIYDTHGRHMVMTCDIKIRGWQQLDLPTMPPGTYFIFSSSGGLKKWVVAGR